MLHQVLAAVAPALPFLGSCMTQLDAPRGTLGVHLTMGRKKHLTHGPMIADSKVLADARAAQGAAVSGSLCEG